MCAHATVGAAWLLDRLGMLTADTVSASTRSGAVEARLSGPYHDRTVEISQPRGTMQPVPDDAVPAPLDSFGLDSFGSAGARS